MKIEQLQPGQIVYSVYRHRMGNTTLHTTEVWRGQIVSINPEDQTVVASWNGYRPERFISSVWSKWRIKEPMLIDTGLMGQKRLATRAELRAMREAQPETKP